MDAEFANEAEGGGFFEAPVDFFFAGWVGRGETPALFFVPLGPGHDGLAEGSGADEGEEEVALGFGAHLEARLEDLAFGVSGGSGDGAGIVEVVCERGL